MSGLQLLDLNDHVLSIVFDMCSNDDLLNLYVVCRRFHAIIGHTTLRRRTLDMLVVGHRNRNAIAYKRTLRDLSYYKRAKVFRNWCSGRYHERILFHQPHFNPTRIILEKDHLYKSHNGQLHKYKRTTDSNGIVEQPAAQTVGAKDDSAITAMAKSDDTIFVGRQNGHVNIIMMNEHDNDSDATRVSADNNYGIPVEAVDVAGDLFATATLGRAAMWRRSHELDIPYLELVHELANGFKCLRFSPNGDCLALGKYRDRRGDKRQALRFVDVETNVETMANSMVSSIYDVQWKDSNIVLTGSFDTNLRLFDRRTDCDEYSWEDPFDLSVYCVTYDGNHGVLCGMQYHCRVNLYDLRMPKKAIQMYFPTSKYRNSKNSILAHSPVYQVANDQNQMFCSTDRNLRVLNFEADWAEPKDYANMFLRVY